MWIDQCLKSHRFHVVHGRKRMKICIRNLPLYREIGLNYPLQQHWLIHLTNYCRMLVRNQRTDDIYAQTKYLRKNKNRKTNRIVSTLQRILNSIGLNKIIIDNNYYFSCNRASLSISFIIPLLHTKYAFRYIDIFGNICVGTQLFFLVLWWRRYYIDDAKV